MTIFAASTFGLIAIAGICLITWGAWEETKHTAKSVVLKDK